MGPVFFGTNYNLTFRHVGCNMSANKSEFSALEKLKSVSLSGNGATGNCSHTTTTAAEPTRLNKQTQIHEPQSKPTFILGWMEPQIQTHQTGLFCAN